MIEVVEGSYKYGIEMKWLIPKCSSSTTAFCTKMDFSDFTFFFFVVHGVLKNKYLLSAVLGSAGFNVEFSIAMFWIHLPLTSKYNSRMDKMIGAKKARFMGHTLQPIFLLKLYLIKPNTD
ncbi:hypothetical protein K501DRAFT_268925 [Backusella circina FSU 941]|nr:hypothetical protein K501DRAFT_268925 [Backusella circina FSU 941]